MMGDEEAIRRDSSASLTKSPGSDLEKNCIGKLTSDHLKLEKRRVSLPGLDNLACTNEEEDNEMTPNFSREKNGNEKPFSIPQDRYLKKGDNGFAEDSKRRGSTISINFDEYLEDPEDGDELFPDEKLRQMRKIHHVIVDCATINYLDASGANVLSHIYTEYSHVNIKLFLAGCSADTRHTMEHAGVFDKIPREFLFLDVHDAVTVAKPQPTLPLPAEALQNFSDEEAIEDSYVTKM